MAVDRIGDGLALRSKGDIVSHDGTANIVISSGTNGQILYAQSSATAGVQWQTPPVAETQDMEIIASSINTTWGAIEFTNIPNTYKHLYLRWAVKSNTGGYDELAVRFNSVTTGSYQYTQTYSTNTLNDAYSTNTQCVLHNIHTSGDLFAAGEMIIASYSDTSYYKSFRAFGGYHGTYYYTRLTQGVFTSTSAITSIRFFEPGSTSLATGSHVTLFGIKG